MNKMTWRSLVTAAAAIVTMPAQAVTFNLVDLGGAGVNSQARIGFETATYFWSSMLRDNITINLNIGFNSLGANVIGQAGASQIAAYNSAVYSALAADRSSGLDVTAVASLQPLSLGTDPTEPANAISAFTNALNITRTGYLDTRIRIDNDGSVNNRALAVNTAVAKALNIGTDADGRAINATDSDGEVTFSSDFKFDFDPRDGIAADSVDFIGVAIHEIGHALGFGSGVDIYDLFSGLSGRQRAAALENVAVSTVLDLFRYSAPGKLDWSTQNTPYMSADGGVTQLFGNSAMSTGTLNGDGQQASHWKDSQRGQQQLGILDPTASRGQLMDVTALDLAAFDMIGWDLSFDPVTQPGYRIGTDGIYARFLAQSAVPEPASWMMMIAGLGIVGGTLRRRRGIEPPAQGDTRLPG